MMSHCRHRQTTFILSLIFLSGPLFIQGKKGMKPDEARMVLAEYFVCP